MVGTALLLATVIGAGKITVPDSAMRFPDPAAFTGVGIEREATMVMAALSASGRELRGSGPGPQQLAARWFAGTLNAAERVTVLLGGASFHDTTLLSVYADALGSQDPRERKAAAVGFVALIGLPPPLPSSIPDTPESWQQLHRLVRTMSWVVRRRPLVRIWVDSYLASRGVRREDVFAMHRTSQECLIAIREVAQPEDLPDVLALWPLLASRDERVNVLRTIEMITLQKLVDQPVDPHKPRGEWQAVAGLNTVDAWVRGLCRSVDGEAQLRRSLERNKLLAPGQAATPSVWFAVARFKYPPFMPLAIEQLSLLGLGSADADRQEPANPANVAAYRQFLDRLPISCCTPEAYPGGG